VDPDERFPGDGKEILPGATASYDYLLRCTTVGSAVITFQSNGRTEALDPVKDYSITADFHIDCVTTGVDEFNMRGSNGRTSSALGFSADSLNWVEYAQNDIVLRVSQIDPVKLEVGKSVEIYSDFDARSHFVIVARNEFATGYFVNATLEFTGGGPITIDSPPNRQSEFFGFTSGRAVAEGATAIWGFRSATLTCVSEGEGVYSANLEGQIAGEKHHQVVSGLVDCIKSPPQPEVTAKPQFVSVYTIDGRPYDQGQFIEEEKHDGCVFTHYHSDITAYPFREWFPRGSADNLQKTGDAPLVDPNPDACGFGPGLSVSGSSFTQPTSIMVPASEFLAFCDRSEIHLIEPASESAAISQANFIETCDNLRTGTE
jgi:hypothetical protein